MKVKPPFPPWKRELRVGDCNTRVVERIAAGFVKNAGKFRLPCIMPPI